VRYIDSVQPPHALTADPVKSSLYPLQTTAAGKLLLSQRADWCARIKDRRLLLEIHAARSEGVAWNRRESDPKVICVATWAGQPSSATPLICIRWPVIRFSESKAASALAKVRRVLAWG
jgi:DNA-binding IclR family transcriptional regulator